MLVVDREGKFLEANAAACRIGGYSREELLEKSIPETLASESKEAGAKHFRQVVTEGRASGEMAYIRKDGTTGYWSVDAVKIAENRFLGFVKDTTERKLAEEALRESQNRLNIALEGTGISVWDWRVKTGDISFDDHWARILGYEPGELKFDFDWWQKSVHPDSFPVFEKALEAYLKGRKEHYELEYRMRTKSGEWKWIWARGICTERDEKGEPVRFLGTHRDVTERKRAEEALRKSEKRLKEAQRVGALGDWQFDVETQQIIWSDEAYRLFERDPASGPPTFEENMAYYYPEDSIKLQEQVRRAVEFGEEFDTDYRLKLPSGKALYHRGIIKTQKDESGKITKLYGTVQDITERKRAEEELIRLSNAVKMSTDSIVISDLEGRIVDVNDATMKMYDADDKTQLIGKNSFDLIAPEDREHALEGLKKTMREGYSGSREYRVITKDGRRVPVETNAALMKDATGKPIGFVGISRDITERRHLRQQLIQSEKLAAVGTLAYGIAHEFNNILAGMMVSAELGGGLTDNPEIKECFDSIVENAGRGSSITNSLLAVAGERKEKKELTDLTRPLENVLSFSHRELEKANMKVVEDFKPIQEILCDPGQFSEVYLNIINNARDAMQPKGGTLTVKVAPYKGNIRIVFKDTGCGIPDEIKNKIFDPFVTTKGALGKSEIPGTGLGLFLTYGIVNSYRGRIEVESETGKGTTFTILIPVSGNLPSEAPPKREALPPGEIDRQLNILLVDDEKIICNVLKRFLESKGHKVTTSLEGSEGFEHFKKDKFDVVLSDITMPGMDGIELIKLMREKDKDSKIIAITGHVQQQKLDEAKDAGAQEVLIKPFRNAKLYETIARLLLETARKDYSGTGTEHKDRNLT